MNSHWDTEGLLGIEETEKSGVLDWWFPNGGARAIPIPTDADDSWYNEEVFERIAGHLSKLSTLA